MHMVNFDAETHDIIATAVNGDNSLAVLGTLFEVCNTINMFYSIGRRKK